MTARRTYPSKSTNCPSQVALNTLYQAVLLLCFPASLVFPVPQWRYKASSTLQLRDSTGFAPVYLLSINTPDTLVFSCSLVRFLTAYLLYSIVYHALFDLRCLQIKNFILFTLYICFFYYFEFTLITKQFTVSIIARYSQKRQEKMYEAHTLYTSKGLHLLKRSPDV